MIINFDKSEGTLFRASRVSPQENAASPSIGRICEEFLEHPLANPNAKESAFPAWPEKNKS